MAASSQPQARLLHIKLWVTVSPRQIEAQQVVVGSLRHQRLQVVDGLIDLLQVPGHQHQGGPHRHRIGVLWAPL